MRILIYNMNYIDTYDCVCLSSVDFEGWGSSRAVAEQAQFTVLLQLIQNFIRVTRLPKKLSSDTKTC